VTVREAYNLRTQQAMAPVAYPRLGRQRDKCSDEKVHPDLVGGCAARLVDDDLKTEY
jgi:hypothetical protein